ncbi:plastocyanin/azurin family copper-binding protein [Conexibacter stalactiti]|uniref:Plastocyanin/azurin family copper-binding protein n=1 Tax=Conexibacter stalactiti TaxID=1940611 RepID=A0ABU4HIQ4_9ACTN|nr:plastocyanin/azurin family copper-binding protein [Conexibacter stalactiti]MDW5593192.1 plastocyanin/azurin family copper-binding protein [Conexibacter stalactiti]MEC5033833.1 plastocyanin/azurin family copper-binding protein [Conexibacter stalactiti]
MINRKLLVAAAAAIVAAGGGALAVVPALAATKTVTVKDNVFAPTALTVAKGTTVRWVWRGRAAHNVSVSRGPTRFHSPNKVRGSYSKQLGRAGTYAIHCTIHPGMKMTVKVR